jgi:hypothetical protein
MSYLTERQAIQARFQAAWGTSTPVAWPGIHFRPPTNAAWVRFTVIPGPADQVSVGTATDLYRGDGDVLVEVFTPLGAGELQALTLADEVVEAFRGWRSGDLAFFTPRVLPGLETDGWWKTDVIAPYQRDSRHARAS